MKFTEKLKSLRNNAGLTQEAAAEQIGVSVTSLQNWESGVNKPSMSNVRKIAEVYEAGCDELAVSMLEDEGEKAVESNFPDFLFPDSFMEKIAEKHFTKELQELFGLLYIYSYGRRYNSIENNDFDLFRIERLPYDYVGKTGAFEILAMVDKLREVLKGLEIKEVKDAIVRNPRKLFDIRTLPKTDICDYINRLNYASEDLSDYDRKRKHFNIDQTLEVLRTLRENDGEVYLLCDEEKSVAYGLIRTSAGYDKDVPDEVRAYLGVPSREGATFGRSDALGTMIIEKREFDDEDYLQKKEQNRKDVDAYNEHPDLYSRKPESFREKYRYYLKMTEKGEELLAWAGDEI